MRKQIISLALMGCLVYISAGFACSKATTLSFTKDAVSFLQEAEPLLVQVGLPDGKIKTAIEYGTKLITALETNSTDTKPLAEKLVAAFEEVVTQTNLIQDQKKKTLILAILGLTNIALHHVLDNITSTPTGAQGAGPALMKFKAKPVWKCRNAQSGRYEKMEFCKAHPDVTVVETH